MLDRILARISTICLVLAGVLSVVLIARLTNFDATEKFSYAIRSIQRMTAPSFDDAVQRYRSGQLSVKDYKRLGHDYLDNYRSKPEVQVTEGGSLYRVLHQGNLGLLEDPSKVEVKFHVQFVDGTVLDDTYKSKSVRLPLAALVPSWKEVLPMHPVGTVLEIVTPSEQAYREFGDDRIPPYSVRVSRVESVGG